MSIYSVSAEFATLSSDSVDLFEISDGRLKFRQGKSGIITAKFMVTQDNGWRKLRLTYRRPGKGLRMDMMKEKIGDAFKDEIRQSRPKELAFGQRRYIHSLCWGNGFSDEKACKFWDKKLCKRYQDC